MRHLARWLTAGALAAVVAMAGPQPAQASGTVAAARCAKETKRLNEFKRGTKAAKRRFFRSHPGKKARKQFVKRRQHKLAKLKRARRRCLDKPQPQPSPPGPAPAPPAPPRFVPDDVVSDAARAPPAEITDDIVRTQLALDLKAGATQAAVDALLARLSAQVVSSLRGVGHLTVRIPDPGSLAALNAILAGLAGDPALDRADLVALPPAEDLPELILPTETSPIRPQLAARAHAAWNARAALTGGSLPSFAVTDHFGDGPPGAAVALTPTAADFATGDAVDHGYLILGLLAGTFDPLGLADLVADQTTGMWAGPQRPVRVVDVKFGLGEQVVEDRLVAGLRSTPGNVVVNTSISAPCTITSTGCTVAEGVAGGLRWIEKVRASNLEGRMIHVAAAGNIQPALPAHTDARLSSSYTSAALLPLPEPNLRNMLVVENAIASQTDPIQPICLRATSKRGGQIAAVGTDVTSLDGPDTGAFLAGGGTSSAAPQVTGAAATVWALDPSLSPAQVVDRLVSTARPAGTSGDTRCNPDVAPAPVLDFYAATLAADDADIAPARAAILDPVNASGDEVIPTNQRFDEKDLAAFTAAFDAADGAVDYGRYDLNGDGRTGGELVDRVDLDRESPPAWDFSERRDVLGLQIGHDENAAADLDVLCHEAAGPLYLGDPAVRDQFFEERCLPPVTLDVALPGSVDAGATNPLSITARRTDISAPDDRLPGVHLDLTVSGGTVDDFVGATDAAGAFSTGARLFSGQSQLRIEVVARAGDGGPELATRAVTAQLSADGTVTLGDATGGIFVRANASGSGGTVDGDNDDQLVPTAAFALQGSATAAGAGASASVQVEATSTLVQSATSVVLTTGGRIRGAASGDAPSRGSGVGTIFVNLDFVVSGGPVAFSASRTGFLPGGSCESRVVAQGDGQPLFGPLLPGAYSFSQSCAGVVSSPGAPTSLDATISMVFRLFG